MNYYKYLFTVCIILINITVYGQGEKVSELNNLLNEGRYFESKELYNEIHNTLDFDEDLSYKYHLYAFMNKRDSVIHCLENILKYYPESLDTNDLNAYVELFNLYYETNNYAKGKSTYNHIMEYLKDNPYNMDESELELCKNYTEERLAYFETYREYPIKLKRKEMETYLNITGKDKLQLDVNFNGIKQKTLFDTGVDCHCIMNRYYAERMGIKWDTSKMIIKPINNTEMPTCQVVMDSIEIGNISLYNIPILMLDNDISKYLPDSIKNDSIKMEEFNSAKKMIDSPIIGLPTMQLIGKFIIDYENSKLYFPNMDDTSKKMKEPNMFFRNNKIYTQVEFNNVEFTGLLDTGSDGYIEIDSVFHEKNKKHIPIDTIAAKDPFNLVMIHRTWLDIPYDIPEKPSIIFNDKHIPPPTESDIPIRIYSISSIWPSKFFDGVIGYDFFKVIGKKVLLDLDNMRLEAIE